MDELYYRVSSIGKAVNKSYTLLYFSVFFFFSHCNSLVYTEGIFLLVFTKGYSDAEVHW